MAVALTVELFLNGAWVNITADVRTDPGLTITFGVPNESATADPATCNMVWNNRDGRYSPRNPASPYYGYLKRNTPLRVQVGGQDRFAGEVSEFPQRWNEPGTDVWVPVVASGVLRRLARANALASPLTTGLTKLAAGGHITGYWPMEDAPGSAGFVSMIEGVAPAYPYGTWNPVLANVDPGVSSDPIPTWQWAMGVAYPRPSTGTGFTAGAWIVIPDAGVADGAELFRVYTAGTIRTWVIRYLAAFGGYLGIRAYNESNVLVLDTVSAVQNLNGTSRFIKFEAAISGANVGWYLQPYPGSGAGGTILAQTVGAPTHAYVGTNQELSTDVGIGHLILGDTSTALFSADLDNAIYGYTGETVVERLTRIAALADVPISFTAAAVQGDEMGVQQSGSALDVMRAAEAADAGGILRDSISQVGLVYITRAARYNDTQPVVTLDYTAGRFSPPLEPTDDDANVRNDISLTRTDGSSYRAVATTGPLNASPYPDGIGSYPYPVTLDIASDAMLPDWANWLLRLGTVDETRWPRLTVDLVKQADILASLTAIRPGHRLRLTNLPAFLGARSADLHVLGWTEVIGSHTRTITFNCMPAAGFVVAELDNATYGRLDAATLVTNEAVDTTETAIDYTGEAIITTAANPTEFPVTIVIGGEEMVLTAATGTVLTVTRSANGVVSTHAIGAPIRLADPAVLAI